MKRLITFLTCLGLAISLVTFQTGTIIAKEGDKAKISDVVWQYDKDARMLFYGFKVTNTKKKSVSNAKIRIIARDDKGDILASEARYVTFIDSKDSVYIGFPTDCPEKPKTVEVRFKKGQWTNRTGSKHWDKVLVTSNTAEVGDDSSYRVTGDLVNKSKKDYTPLVSCVLKQEGEIVAVYSTYIDELEAKDSTAFEINGPSASVVPEHDEFECHATDAF